MEFLIPLVNEKTFLKKINRYVKKANGAITLIPTDDIELKDYNNVKYRCRKYIVSGSYKINNWEFVAEIEHKDSGNVIRCVKPEYERDIVNLYAYADPRCEHCGVVRDRNTTFIVYNKQLEQFKQVGKSCLKDYTGFDAEVCAAIAQIVITAEDFEDIDIDSNLNSRYLDGNIIRKLAYYQVSKYGYDRIETKEFIDNLYFSTDAESICNKIPDDIITDISMWLKMKAEDNNNAYYHSCNVLWHSDYIEYRDLNYILSAINIYLKEQKNRYSNIMNPKNEYVGNIGDKISITVESTRCLYEKGRYAYRSDYRYQLEIKDKEGHTYIWSCIYNELDKGTVINATVKDHKEYKGIKQTVITRGKIISKPENADDNPADYDDENARAIRAFIDYCEGDDNAFDTFDR